MTKTKSKSKAIKEEATVVTVVGTCGRLPLIPEDVEWVNPTHSVKVPGVCLELGDNGAVVLDPSVAADKEVLDVLLPILEAGDDERIVQHAIQIVPPDRVQAPYPAWGSHTVAKCVERVEELGLDPELCLRHELGRGDEARPDLVAKLEELVDKPAEEDPLSVPEL